LADLAESLTRNFWYQESLNLLPTYQTLVFHEPYR